MVVLTQAARQVGDTPALRSIEEAGGHALQAIRRIVSAADRSPTPRTPADLKELFEQFPGQICFRVDTDAPPEVIAAAHRIATEARVEAGAVDVDKHLELTVRNDRGDGEPLGSGGGHGLHGMRYRAEP